MASKKSLRFARPPYMAHIGPALVLPGALWLRLQSALAPSGEEAVHFLRDLRSKNHWSREMLGGVLGTTAGVIRSWEKYERCPGRTARKMIWLVHTLLNQSSKLRSAQDLLFWNKGDNLGQLWSDKPPAAQPEPVTA